MVATSHPLATKAALDVLDDGGHAVDAAICANALLGFAEPTGCGIGGDLFAIVWDAREGKLRGYNGSGRSPAGLTLGTFEKLGLTKIPPHGPLPVSVPGAVDGWFALHERWGTLPMSRVLGPAIGAARDGAPVPEVIAYYWGRNAAVLDRFDGFRRVYMPGGRAPKAGDVFRNPELARTYELLARDGRDAYYAGPVAKAIDALMRREQGYLRASDLAQHRGEWVDPVSTRYRGVDVWELPPNGQGIAALQMLNLLEGFDVAEAGRTSADYLHWLIEAKKVAFADRARFYADPAFHDLPVDQLISKDYARSRRKLIGKRAAASIEPGTLRGGDTIYLTTADANGNMVSLIQSNFRGMGSGMVPDDMGFNLQDRGELFALDPAHYNVYAPQKRPFHTIIPAFATRDGKPWLSFGVMGGAAQPQMHTQVIVNLVDFGLGLQAAGDAPRMLHTGSSQPTGEVMTDGGQVHLESGFLPETLAELERRGHRIVPQPGGYGGYQAIARDHVRAVYVGASESRKDGLALGY